MVCEKERVKFQAVASFSFAYSKTEMAAAFFVYNEGNSFGAYHVPPWTFYFRFPLLFFADL